jgi:hypothetical protein
VSQVVRELDPGAGLALLEIALLLVFREWLGDGWQGQRLQRAPTGQGEGLQVQGSVGLLETSYLRGYVGNLRAVFGQLLANSYVDQRLLNLRLRALGLLPP